ncbi:transglycosylase domain-containing protein [Syntrophomonas erecta]
MKWLQRTGLVIAGLLVFIVFFLVGASVTKTTPRLLVSLTGLKNWEYQTRQQSVIYYSDGKPMTEIGYKRTYSQDFPQFMQDAVVAVEDQRFYEHNGLDTRSIGRAIYKNIRAGKKAEGASTITQQTARTLFLTQEKTYTRKIKEVLLASALEEKFSKQAILNMYLNEIYMGRGCSGMACAANSYFGKDLWSLNRAEICMLVGMIQAPEHYSPDTNREGLKQRQEVVINVLSEQGVIGLDEARVLKQQAVYFRNYQPNQGPHPYLVSYLVWKLKDLVGAERLYQGGINIYITIDRNMQNAAENAVVKQARSLGYQGITARDMALVSLDPHTGGIKALVGGVDFGRNQLNMAVLPRQPGSAIKPLYYAAAMNDGLITPDTILNNRPRDFGGYQPRNQQSSAPDQVSVREALVRSYNVASVEVLNQLGIERAFRSMEDLGITTLEEDDRNLALALGGLKRGISPLELANAYTVFPNNGYRAEHYLLERVETVEGRVLYQSKTKSVRVFSRGTIREMDNILRDVMKRGTGTVAAIAIPAGGKTGTTTDSRDLWFVGYTNDLVTAVWAGNSNGEPVKGYNAYGGRIAGPVWRNYMNTLYYSHVLEDKPSYQPVEEPSEPEEPLEEDLELEEEQPEEGTEPGDNEPDTGKDNDATTPSPSLPPEEPVSPAPPEPSPGDARIEVIDL